MAVYQSAKSRNTRGIKSSRAVSISAARARLPPSQLVSGEIGSTTCRSASPLSRCYAIIGPWPSKLPDEERTGAPVPPKIGFPRNRHRHPACFGTGTIGRRLDKDFITASVHCPMSGLASSVECGESHSAQLGPILTCPDKSLSQCAASPGGTSRPVTPGSATSQMPPVADPITGTAWEKASNRSLGCSADREGSRTAS